MCIEINNVADLHNVVKIQTNKGKKDMSIKDIIDSKKLCLLSFNRQDTVYTVEVKVHYSIFKIRYDVSDKILWLTKNGPKAPISLELWEEPKR